MGSNWLFQHDIILAIVSLHRFTKHLRYRDGSRNLHRVAFLLPFSSLPFPLFPSLLLRSIAALHQLGVVGERCKLPCGVRVNRVEYIVFWSACFTTERSKFSTSHNTAPFSVIRSTVTCRCVAQRGGGAGSAPLNPPLRYTNCYLGVNFWHCSACCM